MPEKIDAWLSDAVCANYKTYLTNLLISQLPDGTFNDEEIFQLNSLGAGQDIATISHEELEARTAVMRNINQYDDAKSGVVFLDSSRPIIAGIPGSEGISVAERGFVKAGNAIREQAKKRNDPRMVQFYEDLADIYTPTNGNVTQLFFTSPYVPSLMGRYAELVVPKGVSSKDLKAQLGVPLYEASLDFLHAIANEARCEYYHQEWGMEPEKSEMIENRLRDEMYEAHSNLLVQYERLKEFYDNPPNRAPAHFGNSLAHLFGRGSGDRHVDPYIGIIRGEKQALENGWDRDDAYIIGVIGSIEAEVRRQEEYGSAKTKEQLSAFKSQLYALKEECYYTRVDSAVQKKELANKVIAFVNAANSPEASPAAKTCCGVAINNIKHFDEISKYIDKSIALERQNQNSIRTEKMNNPVEYINGLLEEARDSGNYRVFLLEYLEMKEQLTAAYPNGGGVRQQFEDAMSVVTNPGGIDAVALQKATNELYFERQIEYGQRLEQKAKDIREGRVNTGKDFDAVKKDYTFSKRYANNLLADSNLARNIAALKEMHERFESVLNNHDETELKNDYIKNATDGLTKAERRFYLTSAENIKTDLMEGYGILSDIDGILGSLPNDELRESTLSQEVAKINEYERGFNEIKGQVSVYLEQLETLARGREKNSSSFENMLTALRKVDELTINDSPKEICEAFRYLGDTSKQYEDKINAQTFAAFWDNGVKRKTLSQTLQVFAKEKLDTLVDIPESMDFSQSIVSQKVAVEDLHQEATEKLHEKEDAKADETLSKLYPEVKTYIDTHISGTKDLLISDNANGDFASYKDRVESRIAKLILLSQAKKALGKNPDMKISIKDVDDNAIAKGYGKLLKNESFKAMMDSVKTTGDCAKLCNIALKNPNLLIDEMNKHKPEAAVEAPANNNIINQPNIQAPNL
ncbi:hypothetical protein SAMN02910298_02581 [Pseudobutyrivibrio sp. YE44]|uniref:hypothetical protein n=1 Tax=Pseudobutyrivibrio sp. YE44 TaxID=1520802 RepID=UPI00088B87D3|nr:hypothetical protein [Pseudobutyrivibrio sp. YE44]SDB50731.1 hypothetical protein SAMN02910298_02581 [Pseudobutyrivibrio sp. YE44]